MKRIARMVVLLVPVLIAAVPAQAANILFDFTMTMTPSAFTSQTYGINPGDLGTGQMSFDTAPAPIYFADGTPVYSPENPIYRANAQSSFSLQFGSFTYDVYSSSYGISDGRIRVESHGFLYLAGAAGGSAPGEPYDGADGLLYISKIDLTPLDSFSDIESIGDGLVLSFGLGSFNYDVEVGGTTVSVDRVTPVPEPSAMLLLGSGLAGLIGYRRRMKR